MCQTHIRCPPMNGMPFIHCVQYTHPISYPLSPHLPVPLPAPAAAAVPRRRRPRPHRPRPRLPRAHQSAECDAAGGDGGDGTAVAVMVVVIQQRASGGGLRGWGESGVNELGVAHVFNVYHRIPMHLANPYHAHLHPSMRTTHALTPSLYHTPIHHPPTQHSPPPPPTPSPPPSMPTAVARSHPPHAPPHPPPYTPPVFHSNRHRMTAPCCPDTTAGRGMRWRT